MYDPESGRSYPVCLRHGRGDIERLLRMVRERAVKADGSVDLKALDEFVPASELLKREGGGGDLLREIDGKLDRLIRLVEEIRDSQLMGVLRAAVEMLRDELSIEETQSKVYVIPSPKLDREAIRRYDAFMRAFGFKWEPGKSGRGFWWKRKQG